MKFKMSLKATQYYLRRRRQRTNLITASYSNRKEKASEVLQMSNRGCFNSGPGKEPQDDLESVEYNSKQYSHTVSFQPSKDENVTIYNERFSLSSSLPAEQEVINTNAVTEVTKENTVPGEKKSPVARNVPLIARNLPPVSRNFPPVARNLAPTARNAPPLVAKNVLPIARNVLPVAKKVPCNRSRRIVYNFQQTDSNSKRADPRHSERGPNRKSLPCFEKEEQVRSNVVDTRGSTERLTPVAYSIAEIKSIKTKDEYLEKPKELTTAETTKCLAEDKALSCSEDKKLSCSEVEDSFYCGSSEEFYSDTNT